MCSSINQNMVRIRRRFLNTIFTIVLFLIFISCAVDANLSYKSSRHFIFRISVSWLLTYAELLPSCIFVTIGRKLLEIISINYPIKYIYTVLPPNSRFFGTRNFPWIGNLWAHNSRFSSQSTIVWLGKIVNWKHFLL